MTGLKAMLFDFDGTLIDSYPAITASVNHVRALHGLSPLSVAEVTPHVGRGPAHLLAATVGVGDPAANVAAYRAHHPTVMGALTHLLPGAAEVLRWLHERGVPRGFAATSPWPSRASWSASWASPTRSTPLLGPEDVGRHKPAPDMLLAAMQRLGVTAAQTLYVGDMTVDIETARAAGVRVWVVPTGSDTAEALDAARPDHRLRDLGEIGPLIEASAAG